MDITATFKKDLNHNGVAYKAGSATPNVDLPMLRFWYQRGVIDVTGPEAILVTAKSQKEVAWSDGKTDETPKKRSSKKADTETL